MAGRFSTRNKSPFAALVAALVASLLAPLASIVTAQASLPGGTPGEAKHWSQSVSGTSGSNAEGPLIAIGILTDVDSVALHSVRTALAVRTRDISARPTASGHSRLDVSVKAATETNRSRLGPVIEVAAVGQRSVADGILEDLRKRFFERPAAEVDQAAGLIRITYSGFESPTEAREMVRRLKRAGYSKAAFLDARERSRPRSVRSDSGAVTLRQQVVVASEAGTEVASNTSRLIIAADPLPRSRYEASPARSGNRGYEATETVKSDERARRGGLDSSIVTTALRPAVRLGRTDYRGEIHVILNPRAKLNVVNVLPLEQYLRGVVPRELSPVMFPHLDALKAQAIAARSYALTHLGRFREDGFDLRSDERSQVYGGMSAEHPLSNRAVEESRGLVITFQSPDGIRRPIEALYSSTCGGHTEDNEAIFLTTPYPYLRGVVCPPHEVKGLFRFVSRSPATRITDSHGRSIARETALTRVLGFPFYQDLTPDFLAGELREDEARRLIARLSQLASGNGPAFRMDNPASLFGFASLLAAAVYGGELERKRPSLDESQGILRSSGYEVARNPGARDLALLLRVGIAQPPAVRGSTGIRAVTRAEAISMLGRAAAHASGIWGLHEGVIEATSPTRRTLEIRPIAGARSSTLALAESARLFRTTASESVSVTEMDLAPGAVVRYHFSLDGLIDYLELDETGGATRSGRLSVEGRWELRLTPTEIQRRAARYTRTTGRLVDMQPVKTGVSGRIVELKLIGEKGSVTIKGHQIRALLGARELPIKIERQSDGGKEIKVFVIAGRGWGHGVGMCQTGAARLAADGKDFTAILKTYYTGVEFDQSY